MRDVELSIRYFGLVNYLEGYTGNLKLFLDETSQKLNDEWDSIEKEVIEQGFELENAIEFTWKLFSDDAFRKWNGKTFERRFNRAVFDVMVYFFREKNTRIKAMENSQAVINAFKKLCDDSSSFRTSIETTTKSIGALSTRLQLWGQTLENILNIEITTPTLDKITGRITLTT
jgi:hypothetical protein